jgi:Spy/CpxP family protein refolding chaperone
MRVSLLLTLSVALVPITVWAQHAGHAHAPGAPSEGHLRAQACLDEFDAVVAEGRGFGMAFAADQQGYPGPMHVLELKDRLALTAEQESRVRALLHAMFAESRPKSARLLDAEKRLRALFAGGGADEATVRAATADVERARAEVRLVHLLAHLKTRELLTDAQRRAYHEARWTPGR